MCRWRATCRWKAFDEGYNFALKLIPIGGLHTKLWAPKSLESQLWEFQNSHLGVLGQNTIWMWASWRGIEYPIKGKVMASPKSEPWWVFWVWVCSWFVLTPKVFQLCTNHLMFGFVQVRVSSWFLSLFLVPSQSSSMPLCPQSATSQGVCPNFLLFCCF